MNYRPLATALGKKLWAAYRQHGYPCKVSVNNEWLAEQLEKQRGLCYDCGVGLTLSNVSAVKQWNPAACKIVCTGCAGEKK